MISKKKEASFEIKNICFNHTRLFDFESYLFELKDYGTSFICYLFFSKKVNSIAINQTYMCSYQIKVIMSKLVASYDTRYIKLQNWKCKSSFKIRIKEDRGLPTHSSRHMGCCANQCVALLASCFTWKNLTIWKNCFST